jgi:hypothetical protein
LEIALSVVVVTYALANASDQAAAFVLLCEEYEMFMIVVDGALETFKPCRTPGRRITPARTSGAHTCEAVRTAGGAGDAEAPPLGVGDAEGVAGGGDVGVRLGLGDGEAPVADGLGDGDGLGVATGPLVDRPYSCWAHATTLVDVTSVASFCMFGTAVVLVVPGMKTSGFLT